MATTKDDSSRLFILRLPDHAKPGAPAGFVIAERVAFISSEEDAVPVPGHREIVDQMEKLFANARSDPSAIAAIQLPAELDHTGRGWIFFGSSNPHR